MPRTDFLLGEDGDMQIVDGDLVTGESDDQNVRLILSATKGTWKQFPLLGVGLGRSLSGTIGDAVKRDIRLHLDSDGYKVLRITTDGTGKIGIKYESNNS